MCNASYLYLLFTDVAVYQIKKTLKKLNLFNPSLSEHLIGRVCVNRIITRKMRCNFSAIIILSICKAVM